VALKPGKQPSHPICPGFPPGFPRRRNSCDHQNLRRYNIRVMRISREFDPAIHPEAPSGDCGCGYLLHSFIIDGFPRKTLFNAIGSVKPEELIVDASSALREQARFDGSCGGKRGLPVEPSETFRNHFEELRQVATLERKNQMFVAMNVRPHVVLGQ
jgi:hypothetical protein